MARAKTRPGTFNDDLLDDGLVRPAMPDDMPPLAEPESIMLESYEVRLEKLRAEIQLGLDDFEAGRGKVYHSAAELYADIMSMAEDDEEETGQVAGSDATRPA